MGELRLSAMPANVIIWLTAAGSVALVISLLLGVSAVLARRSGWAELASSYGQAGGAWKPEFTAESVAFGPVKYSRTVEALVAAEGLYLRMFFTVRFRHAPLFIPWSAISSVTYNKETEATNFSVSAGEERIKIGLFGELAELAIKAWRARAAAIATATKH